VNALVSVLLVLLAQVAAPPGADPVAKAKAQAVLKEGTALYERGDFAAALDRFETAYGIFPSPKLQFNIGQADRSLGRPLEAVEAFEKFLAQVPDAAPELLSEARQSVVELRGKLGQVKIECATPGAEVAMPLSARVCWKGHPGGQNGFGVEWKARDAGGNRRIKELVRRIEAQGAHARVA